MSVTGRAKQEFFTDALGSIIATADDGATSLAKQYTYDPDGNRGFHRAELRHFGVVDVELFTR